MTKKQFYRAVTDDKIDVIEVLVGILDVLKAPYCLIGGLAVNSYVDPLVSLNLDLVVATDQIESVTEEARAIGFKVTQYQHSVNLDHPEAKLRIQLQTDPYYQEMVSRAERREVMGYDMFVARVEDVYRGKLMASQDEAKRPSKRQKDLLDIARLEEKYPELKALRD